MRTWPLTQTSGATRMIPRPSVEADEFGTERNSGTYPAAVRINWSSPADHVRLNVPP